MVCDLCSRELPSPEHMRYPAAEFRAAIAAGLRPPEGALRNGEAVGMSRDQMEVIWVSQALASKTDWVLCASCAGAAAARLLVAGGVTGGGGRARARSGAMTFWAAFFAVAGVAPLMWTFGAFHTPVASPLARWVFAVLAVASGLLAWGAALTLWIGDDVGGALAVFHGFGMVVVLAMLPAVVEPFSYGWLFFGGCVVYLALVFGAAMHLLDEI